MKVIVRFHLSQTLTGISDDEIGMELNGELSLREFLSLLGERYPVFARNFLSFLRKRNMRMPLLTLVNKESSSLDQTIRHGDCIDMFLIAAGG
jgi:hypothetical protein